MCRHARHPSIDGERVGAGAPRPAPQSPVESRTIGLEAHHAELLMTTITVNNQMLNVDAAPDTPLLWVLRDHLGMTGTKYGCGMALCGACTVHIDGAATRSCVLPLSAVAGKSITTIEGLSARPQPRRAKSLARDRRAAMRILSVRDRSCPPRRCSRRNPTPNDADIDAAMSGNICRCGTYPRIRKAIHRAAEMLRDERAPK